MVERYHHSFGTTSNPKFRVLHAISELQLGSRSEIEDYLRGTEFEKSKLLPSNIRSIVAKGIDQLLGDGYIVQVDDNPPHYQLTESGAEILYEV